MCDTFEFTETESLFFQKLEGQIFFDKDINKYIYQKNISFFYCNLSKKEIDKLMEQSLKEGKDLIYELCKDKPVKEKAYIIDETVDLAFSFEE